MELWKRYTGIFFMMLFFLAGCNVEKTDREKVRDLDFTIVEEDATPEELQALIEENKQTEFKMTFDSEDAKYIIVGYGRQQTGGYSISVEELYLTGNAIYINTSLIGPSKGENVSEVESFPYIVIKMEYSEKNVVFQ